MDPLCYRHHHGILKPSGCNIMGVTVNSHPPLHGFSSTVTFFSRLFRRFHNLRFRIPSAPKTHNYTAKTQLRSGTTLKIIDFVLLRLVFDSQLSLRSSPRPISIGQLHTLPCFHLRPINLIVCKGSYYISIWDTLS